MKMSLLKQGVDGTVLRVNPLPGGRKKTAEEIGGVKLEELALLLTEAEELVRAVERGGVTWAELLAGRNKAGDFPGWMARISGAAMCFHAEADAARAIEASLPKPEKKAAAQAEVKEGEAPEEVVPDVEPPEPEELFGAKELNKLSKKLESRGLDLADWHLEAHQELGEEKAHTRFTVVTESESVDIAGVAQVLPAIRRLGQKGMEIQRFKGLGEMNAEQLWQTTMNPALRTMKRVLIEDAAEAEHIFSVLMGNAVEPRREFIETHALEVRNLDV
jgi:DNA gyrase subunit B